MNLGASSNARTDQFTRPNVHTFYEQLAVKTILANRHYCLDRARRATPMGEYGIQDYHNQQYMCILLYTTNSNNAKRLQYAMCANSVSKERHQTCYTTPARKKAACSKHIVTLAS